MVSLPHMKNTTLVILPIILLGLADFTQAENTITVKGDLTVESGRMQTTADFTAGNDAPAATKATISSPSTGDSDFDLRSAGIVETSIGDVDRDGSADKTAPTVSNEGRDRARVQVQDSDASVDPVVRVIGDPDFDLLTIDVDEDGLAKLRADAAGDDQVNVKVRGWNPKKKEEIVAHPEVVKTAADLKIYTEAIALTDPAIKGIKIKENALEVESVEHGKLFWFIPVEMSSNVVVRFKLQDSTSDPVEVRLPWWHVFVQKSVSPIELETEITGAFDPSKWEKIGSSDFGRASATIRLVSNIMKTKHDTVKNSISNVR